MPVLKGASYKERSAASYLVETVYRQTDHGVYLMMSTARSNAIGG